MGLITSFYWQNAGRTDDPDPETGLTSRQKYIIRTTWKKLTEAQNNLLTGINLFLGLFEINPEYQQLFPFRNIPRKQLKENCAFQAHCVSVMYALSSIIDNVDDGPMMTQILKKQVANHVARKVPNQAYLDLKKAFLKILAVKSLNDEEVKTWQTFLDCVFEIMIKSATEYQEL